MSDQDQNHQETQQPPLSLDERENEELPTSHCPLARTLPETPSQVSQWIQDEQPKPWPTDAEKIQTRANQRLKESGLLENSPPDHSQLGKVKGGERAPYEIGDAEGISTEEGLYDILAHARYVVEDKDGKYGYATRQAYRSLLDVYNYMKGQI